MLVLQWLPVPFTGWFRGAKPRHRPQWTACSLILHLTTLSSITVSWHGVGVAALDGGLAEEGETDLYSDLGMGGGGALPRVPVLSSGGSPIHAPGGFLPGNVFSAVLGDCSFWPSLSYFPQSHQVTPKNRSAALAEELSWLEHHPDVPRSWVRSQVRERMRIKQ